MPTGEHPLGRNQIGREVLSTPDGPERKRRRVGTSSRHLQQLDEVGNRHDPHDRQTQNGVAPTISFRISDRDQVTAHYQRNLHALQHVNLKTVLKAWIKAIEPRKQTNYPYTCRTKPADGAKDKDGLDSSRRENLPAPPWWPQDLRHKEPDHLGASREFVLGSDLALSLLTRSRMPYARIAHIAHQNWRY